jgi:hypothetical protein
VQQAVTGVVGWQGAEGEPGALATTELRRVPGRAGHAAVHSVIGEVRSKDDDELVTVQKGPQ